MSEANKNPRNERPISLYPLTLKEALKKAMNSEDKAPKKSDESPESNKDAETSK